MKKAKRFLTGLLSAALALSLCAMPAMAAEGTTNVDTSKVNTPQKNTGNHSKSGLDGNGRFHYDS